MYYATLAKANIDLACHRTHSASGQVQHWHLASSVLTQLALALKVWGADLHFKCFALKVLGTKYTGT